MGRVGRRRWRSLPIGKQVWHLLLPLAATAVVLLFGGTLRMRRLGAEHEEALLRSGKGFIYAFWHRQLLYFTYRYRRSRIMVLTSPSEDGELISRVIEGLGILTSRGSITGGGGAGASVRLLHYMMKSSMPISICPDGPRGPRCVATKGIVFLASWSGCPILPLANGFKKSKVFNTWDRFILPYPFTTGAVVFGPPIWVPADVSEAEIEEKRQELEDALNAVSAEAEACLRR